MNLRLLTSSLMVLTVLLTTGRTGSAGLFEYVQKPDSSYSWENLGQETTPEGITVTHVKLTSQTWEGITWTHQLTIYEPKELRTANAALLFIGGGSNQNGPLEPDPIIVALARVCGTRVAELSQVPNQPLLGDRKEDSLISETFVRFLETGDTNWPLLLPMTKSAVRAMDAIQDWSRKQGKPVERFVVTGASKRGWTTWLTGAVDDRVIAIAPMVIPMLDIEKQLPHQLETWGRFSEQIADYTQRGLTGKFDTPRKVELWKMVDPFTYLVRLKNKPTLQINGTNDRYWTLDSVNLFWDGIEGPKYLDLVPNAGHNLQTDHGTDYTINTLGAFFLHTIAGRPFPELRWKHSDGPDGKLRLDITARPAPKLAQLQIARSETKDFRDSKWAPAATASGETISFTIDRPASGSIALFGDLTYELLGHEYHLSTQVRQVDPPMTAK